MSTFDVNNTAIIFFCSSPDYSCNQDVKYGYEKFRSKSRMEQKNLFVFIDKSNNKNLELFLEVPAENILNVDTIFQFIKNTKYKNIMMFTSGHGDHRGLQSCDNKSFAPTKFNEAVDFNQNLKNIVFVWNQCYAGVYKSLDQNPKIIQVGSTDMTMSLIDVSSDSDVTWEMNVFTYYGYDFLFKSPIKDLDEDGTISLYDLYNYTCYKTNTDLLNRKENFLAKLNLLTRDKQHLPGMIASLKENVDQSTDPTQIEYINAQIAEHELHLSTIPTKIKTLFNEPIPWASSSNKLLRVNFNFLKKQPREADDDIFTISVA